MSGKHVQKKESTMSKKKKITILSISAGVVVLVVACLLFFFVFSGIPDVESITSDLNKDKSVTNIQVGEEVVDFEVSSLEIISKNKSDDGSQYIVEADVVRTSDLYQTNNTHFTITYNKVMNRYSYESAILADGEEITLTAIKGNSTDDALEIVTEKFTDGITFTEQVTDLEKGTDKIYFTIENKEYDGTVFVLYKFDSKDGWVYKKINEDKLGFKPGVTHKEDGLYTNSNIKNVLFLGIDAESNAGRSDCMMLVSVDSNTGKIKLTSFMRDTYVTIPGRGGNKLNSAFALGGADLVVDTIESTYGIKIDNYVSTNFTTFKNLINAVGGVNVNISADEAGYINWQISRNGQTSVGYVPASGGNVTLNGQQALWLCRDRGGNGFSGNDFVRTSRQRRVIEALINRYANSSASQLLSTANALVGNVSTDLTTEDFEWYAERGSKFLNYDTEGRCVPDDGEWSQSYSSAGAWIIQVNNWDTLKSDVQKYIYEDLE